MEPRTRRADLDAGTILVPRVLGPYADKPDGGELAALTDDLLIHSTLLVTDTAHLHVAARPRSDWRTLTGVTGPARGNQGQAR